MSAKALLVAVSSADAHDRKLLGVWPHFGGLGSSYGLFLKISGVAYVVLCVGVLKSLWDEQTKAYGGKKRVKKD